MIGAPVLTPAGAWPQNILRFHLLFPEPMDGWRALDHVWLERADGSRIEGALVDMPDGLWSADQRCLTVLFHPARIKTGLAAQRALGAALTVGDTVQVAIGPGLLTQNGATAGPRAYPVQVRPPVRQALDVRRWGAAPGKLFLGGAAPIDYVSACAHIRVLDAQARRVRTTITAIGGALSLRWDPRRAAGLRVDRRLEDVCGNRIGAAFEAARV